jgi:hypothetical protein
MAEIVETIPFDFNSIYKSVEQKFADKNYDIEEGSNTSQLITAMSYLVSMLNVNTAVNVNETILTLANKRNNVLQTARVLGYEIAHKQSYRYELTLTFAVGGTFDIPKYSEFTAEGKTFYYFGNGGSFTVADGGSVDIEVKEGTLRKFETTPELNYKIKEITDDSGRTVPEYYIDIPFIDVEDDGLEVSLSYIDDDGLAVSESWSRTNQFMIDTDTLLNKNFVRLDNIDYNTPRIYFKLSNVGRDLKIGTDVSVNVLTTSHVNGGLTDPMALVLPVGIKGSAVITDAKASFVGADEETISSIKANAPLFHNSANRAVTKSDYIAICNRQTPVRYSHVWDGEDVYPKHAGHIYFSFLPSTNIRNLPLVDGETKYALDETSYVYNDNWFLQDTEIKNNEDGVFDVLDNYKIPTLEFTHFNPTYVDFNYKVNIVRYSINASKADVNASVMSIIDNYFKNYDETTTVLNPEAVENFNYEYFQSSLTKRIDTHLTDITGFNIELDTKIMLTSKNISTSTDDNTKQSIYVYLGVPFETYVENEEVNSANLPKIDTINFIGGANLSIGSVFAYHSNIGMYETDVLLGNLVVGKYQIHTGTKQYIVIELFINDVAGVITNADFTEKKYIDLVYPSPNIKFLRNTIPRLKTVAFH